jgi:predicted nucleotidyltransferase component of viral defense system
MLEIRVAKAGLPSLEYVGPLGASRPRRLKIDLAVEEHVESVARGTITSGLWDDLPEAVAFDVYPLGEIAAEKLRCVIQRVQCRDLYDLHQLTHELGVDLRDIRTLFERKAWVASLDPATFPDRFEYRVARYGERWNEEMSEYVDDPPRFDDVIRVVRRHLRAADLI